MKTNAHVVVIYCINKPDRPERWASILAQDWGYPVELVEAVVPSRPNLMTCNFATADSHRKVITYHWENHGDLPFLILEDDAKLIDREEYLRLLADPPPGWTNLGHRPVDRFPHFWHAHAMLCGGLLDGEFSEATAKTEWFYQASYGPIRLLDHVVVDTETFVSDRTRLPQTSLLLPLE